MRLIKGSKDKTPEQQKTKISKDEAPSLLRLDCPTPMDPLQETDYHRLLILITDFKNRIRQTTLILGQDYENMSFYRNEIIDLMKYFKFSKLEIKAMDELLDMMLITDFDLEQYVPLSIDSVDVQSFRKVVKELCTFSGLVADKFSREIHSDLTETCPDIKILFLSGSLKDRGAKHFVDNIIEMSQVSIFKIRLMIKHFSDIYRDLNYKKKPVSRS